MSFELEIEDDRFIPIENSHLSWGRCTCGARALVAPGVRRVRCASCLVQETGAGQGVAELAGRYAPVVGYPLGRGVAPVAQRLEYPAPEVTSRDPWDGDGCPSAVAKLAERAREASWDVRVQRSRGCAPHATHGRPGALKSWFAVVMRREDWHAYAVHDGGGWASVMLWGRDLPWFAAASITDLAEWIEAGGGSGVPAEWYVAIVAREVDKDRRAKERAACARGTHPGAYLVEPGVVHCPACDQNWPANRAAPKRVTKGKDEAL